MRNNYTDRNIFDLTSRNIEGLDKRVKDLQKQQLVPTLPAYDAKKFPPNRIARASGNPVPAEEQLDYNGNYYPNRATYGQIVRDTNNYDGLWVYQDDEKWHPFGTLARIRLEKSYNYPEQHILGGEVIVDFDYVYNPYPGIFDVNPMIPENPGEKVVYIQMGGVYASTYRLFYDFTGAFVDTEMMTERFEVDWNGWCGYDIYHRSIDNGVWATVIFTIGNDVNEMWPAGYSSVSGVSWPPGIPQYMTTHQPAFSDTIKNNIFLGDTAFGNSNPDYYQGSYLEITRLGGTNVDDLNVDVDTSGLYFPPEEDISGFAVSEAEAQQMFEQLPSQQVPDIYIAPEEMPIAVQRRRDKVSPLHSIRQGGA